MTTIYLAADHAGFAHKEALKQHLLEAGQTVIDCGAYHVDSTDDYPDFIAPAAEAVRDAPAAARAIIFGGSGQGEAMVANAYPNVRATVYYGGPPDIITLSREHNDANVLSIGARFVSIVDTLGVVDRWLATDFSSDERHVRRLQKRAALPPRLPI